MLRLPKEIVDKQIAPLLRAHLARALRAAAVGIETTEVFVVAGPDGAAAVKPPVKPLQGHELLKDILDRAVEVVPGESIAYGGMPPHPTASNSQPATQPVTCPGADVSWKWAPSDGVQLSCDCSVSLPRVPSRKEVAQARAERFNLEYPPGTQLHVSSGGQAPFYSTVTAPCRLVQAGHQGQVWHCVVVLDGARHVVIEMTDCGI